MIVGTAGHIDHGKSSLVEKLTGARMDRLQEEQKRGITIELNFARWEIVPGVTIGVVDVPGHEDFVRTMVAGASGIDVLLLVIAADEGIKPQTREHLAIAEQLGIPLGIPVLTKADLVDADWIALVSAEVSEWLASSSISFLAPRPVSVLSDSGIAELRADIEGVLAAVPARQANDVFRLPIDRAFSVAGIGTVVTGTAWSGNLAPGAQVHIMPGRQHARVRTVQSHGRDIAGADPGMRVALGLAGIGRDEVRRGDTVVQAEVAWESSLILDVRLVLLPSAPRSLTSRSRVRLHLGTSEVMARVHPRGKINPAESQLARLTLESPVLARGGDRFVIRSESPVTTIGGGVVIDPLPPRRRAGWPEGIGGADLETRVHALIARRSTGLADGLASIVLGLSPIRADALLKSLPGVSRAGEYWVNSDMLAGVQKAAVDRVEDFHRSHPALQGMPLANLRQQLRASPWVVTSAMEQAETESQLVVKDGLVRRPAFRSGGAGGSEQVRRVVALIEQAGLTPPRVVELEEILGVKDLISTLRLAARENQLEAVEVDRYYSPKALAQFVASVVELGRAGSISPGLLRDRLGISRKYLIPLLEWADARGITVRTGTDRHIRPGYQLPWPIPAP
jgi:selenocysteine-specific elongation factor